MQLRSRFFLVPVLLLSLLVLQPFQAFAQVDITVTCFNETGFCMAGRIKQYWDQNGGLAVFGFPISDQHQELVEGKPFQVQVFQRNRFELHPENTAPYDVLLGRLGVVRLEQQGRDWTKFGKSSGGPVSSDCLAFSDTGQNVCGAFLNYFKTHGLEFDGAAGKSYAESLALFGYPISPSVVETNGSGDTVETQWFERARFEYHPNNPDPYKVELGLLGSEVKDAAAAAPPPPPPPPATIPPAKCAAPALKDADVYPSQCMTTGSWYWMSIRGFQPNEQIGYWLNDPTGQPVAGTRITYNIGPTGAADFTKAQDASNFYPGTWSWVFEGTTSHHQSILYFRVVDEDETGIQLLSVNGAGLGSKASVNAKSSPNTRCSLDYWTPKGNFSTAKGLGDATTDAQGNVSWSWTIGTDTNPGNGHIQVTCNNNTVNRPIAVG